MVRQQSHKANPENSHLSFFELKNFEKSFFGGVLVESSSTEKLLRIQIDSDLTFDEYISSICNKVGKKLMHSAALLIICHLISAVG